jgi:1-acyl-sn-glycerol-3-phosphate acyltransferase
VKKEAFEWPLFGTIVRKVGHLSVDRGVAAQSTADIERIQQALAQRSAVLAFPEGTFTRARGLRPFRLGAFKAAVESGCPVVPVAIQGSRSVLPDQTWLPRLAPVRILIRPPIWPLAKTWAEIVRLRDAAFAEVLAHCGEPRLEVVSAAIPRATSV